MSRLTTLERDGRPVNGSGEYVASRPGKGKITGTELQIIQVDRIWSAKSQGSARDQHKIGEFVEAQGQAEDQFVGRHPAPPQDGMVLQSTVHSGG